MIRFSSSIIRQVVVSILVSIPLNALAAGYLEFDDKGNPFKWDASVTYHLDAGKLGGIPKGDPPFPADPQLRGADGLVEDAMAAWEVVSSTPAFVRGTDTVDVNATNLPSYVNFNGTGCPVADFVVVYDDDGTIFSNLFGSASGNILGLSTPSQLSNSTKQITCGYALLNGSAVSSGDTIPIERQMYYTLLHELGHGRNLEHSQINQNLYTQMGGANDQYIPLMFPIIPGNIAMALSGGIGGIKLDDQFSLLYLYNQAVLNTEGRIKGTVTDYAGDGILGANVICSDKANPEQNVVSFISDATLGGTGDYNCGHLPAGNYNVKMEPIVFALNSWSQGNPPYLPTEFFNGEKESGDASIDKLDDKVDVAVPASTTVSNVDMVINDNGRVTSTQTVKGSVSPLDVAPLEYFIYVPKSVTKATFTMKGSPSGIDMDLYGRCGSAFSLATDTTGPFYDPDDSSSQATFAGASDGASETVVIDGSSSPKIKSCDYHLLIVNYNNTTTGTFELKATLVGQEPLLRADFSPQKEVQNNGETLVSNITFVTQNDQFTIKSLKFTDQGIASVSNVTLATLYLDENNNGRVDSADKKVGTSTVDTSSRKFKIEGLNIYIAEAGQKKLLLTYSIPSSSSATGLIVLMMGLIVAMLLGGYRKEGLTVSLVLASLILMKCSSSATSDFDPTIKDAAQIEANASAFGSKYSVQIGKPTSVKDFFN